MAEAVDRNKFRYISSFITNVENRWFGRKMTIYFPGCIIFKRNKAVTDANIVDEDMFRGWAVDILEKNFASDQQTS